MASKKSGRIKSTLEFLPETTNKITIHYMAIRISAYSSEPSVCTVYSIPQALDRIEHQSSEEDRKFDPIENGYYLKDVYINNVEVVKGSVGHAINYEISVHQGSNIKPSPIPGVIYGPETLHGYEEHTGLPILACVMEKPSAQIAWHKNGDEIKTETDIKISLVRPHQYGPGTYTVSVNGQQAGRVQLIGGKSESDDPIITEVHHVDSFEVDDSKIESTKVTTAPNVVPRELPKQHTEKAKPGSSQVMMTKKKQTKKPKLNLNPSVTMIPKSSINIGEMIKSGGMGIVFDSTYLGSKVAAKKIAVSGRRKELIADAIAKEVNLHSTLHCKNIVQLIGVSVDVGEVFIITELVSGPDLDTYIFDEKYKEDYQNLDKVHLNIMASDMAKAVAYLHGQNPPVIHQDLKPGNFVVEVEHPRKPVKLIDLGIGRIRNVLTMGQTTYSDQFEGTLSYMPPEKILESKKGSQTGDIWGLACVLVELFGGRDIWLVAQDTDADKGIDECEELKALMTEQTMPHGLSHVEKSEHYDIFFQCLNYNANDRPTAEVLVEYFNEASNDD